MTEALNTHNGTTSEYNTSKYPFGIQYIYKTMPCGHSNPYAYNKTPIVPLLNFLNEYKAKNIAPVINVLSIHDMRMILFKIIRILIPLLLVGVLRPVQQPVDS